MSERAREIYWNLFTDALDKVLVNGKTFCEENNPTVYFDEKATRGTLTTEVIEDVLAIREECLQTTKKTYFTGGKTRRELKAYETFCEALNIVLRTINAKRTELGI